VERPRRRGGASSRHACAPSADAAPRARGRARRGARRRAGASRPVLHTRCPATRSSGSSRGAAACRCTGPTARTPSRLRSSVTTASGSSTSQWDDRLDRHVRSWWVEVKALDRSRLLRDVTPMLSDQQVNIVACNTMSPAAIGCRRCASSSSWPTRRTSRAMLRHDQADRRGLRRLPGRCPASRQLTAVSTRRH
jgi:hypothetical protein